MEPSAISGFQRAVFDRTYLRSGPGSAVRQKVQSALPDAPLCLAMMDCTNTPNAHRLVMLLHLSKVDAGRVISCQVIPGQPEETNRMGRMHTITRIASDCPEQFDCLIKYAFLP